MNQQQDGRAAARWRESRFHRPIEQNDLRDHLTILERTLTKLHAMRSEYLELKENSRLNLEKAHALWVDINLLAQDLGLAALPSARIETPSTEITHGTHPRNL